jgi:hypothetical protein
VQLNRKSFTYYAIWEKSSTIPEIFSVEVGIDKNSNKMPSLFQGSLLWHITSGYPLSGHFNRLSFQFRGNDKRTQNAP